MLIFVKELAFLRSYSYLYLNIFCGKIVALSYHKFAIAGIVRDSAYRFESCSPHECKTCKVLLAGFFILLNFYPVLSKKIGPHAKSHSPIL